MAISSSRPGEACHSVKDMSSCSVSSTGNFFAEFRPENYYFDLYTGFFMENFLQIRQILTTLFFFSSRQIFIISSLQ